MPKIKTKKSLLKRVKITKSGKMLRRHRGSSHLKTGKSAETQNRKSKLTTFSKAFERKLKRLT
ncbi:MAG: 50S ribosomal protein L35, partial [candidate division WWE3 bacterium]|nr:50S ribosomal protein L35 [candidate division WWE3 bacterium]